MFAFFCIIHCKLISKELLIYLAFQDTKINGAVSKLAQPLCFVIY